ncbi:MAG: hypothetical protein HYR83_13380 [Planctomycetes bacterium]|nr:hypothetical protein [Planctomycetota bacterium]
MVERKSLDDLLRCPFRRWMSRDAEVNNVAPIVAKNDESEKYSKCRCGDGKKVDRDDISNMVVQECSPSLRRRLAYKNSIFVDGRLSDDVTQECEFRLNARRSPQGIFTGDTLDQPANLHVDLWASGISLRLPPQEQFESSPMPSHHGFGSQD